MRVTLHKVKSYAIIFTGNYQSISKEVVVENTISYVISCTRDLPNPVPNLKNIRFLRCAGFFLIKYLEVLG